MLYHGSSTGGITALHPGVSNHGKPYVYLTDSPTLALLYAHNPIARPGGFFTYWFDKAGLLHYDEYFPDQTRRLYQSHSGWVYTAEDNHFSQLDKMPWVYLAEGEVPVAHADFIPDLYAALLEAEAAGKLVLHRYEDIPEKQREIHRRVARPSADEPADYVRFLREYMPEVFE